MLSNMKIGQRIAISLVLLLALTVAVLLAFFLNRFNSVIAQAEQRELRGLFDNISAAIDSEAVMSERMSALVAAIPDVQQAMAWLFEAEAVDPGFIFSTRCRQALEKAFQHQMRAPALARDRC